MVRRGPRSSVRAAWWCLFLPLSLIAATTALVVSPVPAGAATAATGSTTIDTAAPSYTFVDLGVNMEPTAVSDTGYVPMTDQYGHPGVLSYVWHDGQTTELPPATGGDVTYVADVNDAGLIAGTSDINAADSANDNFDAVTWQGASPTTAHNLGTGVSGATYLNASGDIVGDMNVPVGTGNDTADPGFEIAHGTTAAVKIGSAFGSFANGDYTAPCGITSDGHILVSADVDGSSGTYLLSAPGTTGVKLDFNSPCDGGLGGDHDISSNGNIVGLRTIGSALQTVLRTANGTETTIGDSSFEPKDVNDSGDVAGLETHTGSPVAGTLVENGVTIPLSTYAPTGWVIGDPTGIDNNGDIVGEAFENGTDLHGFLLERQNNLTVTTAVGVTAAVAPGGSVPVTVTVTAGKALSGVAWGSTTPAGLAISPTAAATVSTALTPALPTSMSAGQTIVLHGTLKAGATIGSAQVSSVVNATVVGGAAVSDSSSAKFAVGANSLTMKITTTPAKVSLDVDKDGKITPKNVTVEVTFTNNTTKAIAGAKLISLQPTAQDPTQQLDKIGVAKGLIPYTVPTIPKKSSVSKKFTVKVTGDGDYIIRATATYPDTAVTSGTARVGETGGAFSAVVPFLFFTASIDTSDTHFTHGADYVKGGSYWYVKGTLKNLSSYQSLCVAPLLAKTTGNAGAIGLQDLATSDVTSPAPPLAGTVKPGASYKLAMLVNTSSLGSTRGEVTIPVDAFKSVTGASCQLQDDGTMSGAGTALTTAQTKIAGGSTEFTIHVDVSVPDNTTTASQTISFFGGVAVGTIKGFAGFGEGLYSMMKQFKSNIATYEAYEGAFRGDPVAAAAVVAAANERVQVLTSLLSHYLDTATPQEKQSLLTQLQSAFDRASGDAYNSLADKWDAIGNAWFAQIQAAEKTGNADDEWAAWGEGSGNLVTSIGLQILLVVIGKQMSGELPAMEAASTDATAAPAELTTSKGGVVAAGRNLTLANEEQAWAISADQDASLGAIAKRFSVLIGIRSRQAVSIALEKLGALWKNSMLHQKTISPLDVDYLGFPKTAPLADGGAVDSQGLLGWRSFTQAGKEHAVRKILGSDLSAAKQKEVLIRLNGRIDEGGADFDKVQRYLNTERGGQKGWINAGFNATESGRATSSVSRWRRFTVVETPITDAAGKDLGTFYQPYQEDINYASAAKFGRAIPKLCKHLLGTVMCPITGDLDPVYITNLVGGSLSSETMLDVFKAMSDAGFAHTDLVTWVEQQSGKFMFPGKAAQLAGVAPGTEAVVQIGPDSVRRATYVDLAKSILTGPNQYQLCIQGGWTPAMR